MFRWRYTIVHCVAGEAAPPGARGGARGAGGGGGGGGARARVRAVPQLGAPRGRLPPAAGAAALADTHTGRPRWAPLSTTYTQ